MQIIKKILLYFVGQAGFTYVVHLIFKRLPTALTENAVMGWLDEQIATALGITSPDGSTVVSWGVPFLLVGAMLWAYHVAHSKLSAPSSNGQRTTSPWAKLEPPRVIAIGLIIVVLGVIAIVVGLVQQNTTPPVVAGTFFNTGPGTDPPREGSPLGWAKRPSLGWQKQSDGSIQVRTFGVDGKNIGNEEVQLNDVYIISGVTGKRVDMKVEAAQDRNAIMAPAKDTNPIPPGAIIRTRTGELNGTQGITEQDFLRDWGTIYFMAEYDGQKRRIIFDRATIDSLFEEQRPKPIPPHITLKSAATDLEQSPTPREIRALYEGRTPLQAEQLVAPYKGRQMKTYGQVITILADGQGGSVAVLDKNGDTIECRFSPRWVGDLNKFSRGDMLKVSGIIADHQNGQQVYLINCEMVG